MAAAPALRIACLGGGPGGLFTAIALAHRLPDTQIDVFERNKASDVFGFGVVFSDATLDNIDRVDPVLRNTLLKHGRHWDRIEVRAGGQSMSAGGNGMSAVHRRILLDALRSRATELGAHIHYATAVSAPELAASGSYDLIVAADGSNSSARQHLLPKLGHEVEAASVKFIWFGTTYQFDGLTFVHRSSPHGNFAVHAYPIGSELSTFIVETDEATWRRAGLDGFDISTPPGPSDEITQTYLEQLFAAEIDGHSLVANNSRWSNFRTRRTRRWYSDIDGTPVVLIGDAVHTAHFSVGSGTKMAMEDAAALASAIATTPDNLPLALNVFESQRQPEVAHIQNSAIPSLSWWDHFGHYNDTLPPWQFGFHFFSRAISAGKIRRRDRNYVESVETAWRTAYGTEPLDTPLRIGDITVLSRILTVTDAREPDSNIERVRLSDGTHQLIAESGDDSALPLFTAPEADLIALPSQVSGRLDQLCANTPAAVVVHGGTALSRTLCAEYVRLNHAIAAIIIDDAPAIRSRRAIDQHDNAVTLILSGRADAIAYTTRSSADSVDSSDNSLAGAIR